MSTSTQLQAPKGGCISEENHERYEGGQFLPSTCLPKGATRKARKLAQVPKNIAQMIVEGNVVLVRYAGEQSRKPVFHAQDNLDAIAFANLTLTERTNSHRALGLVPHPTEKVGF